MVLVSFSPEGLTSFRKLPREVQESYHSILTGFEEAPRMRLPGRFPTHELEGGRGLWTLKVGPYRGIFHWDGREARFVRFGHVRTVYSTLPK